MLRIAFVIGLGFGIASSVALAAPRPHVSSIVYSLGGIMSGPYRVSADLPGATASEANAPPGKIGDGAGISTASLPVTSTRPLSPDAISKLDALASVVWRVGPERKPVQRRGTDGHGHPSFSIAFCQPSLDALGRFEIIRDGMLRTFDFSTVCMSKAATELLTALTCSANPDSCAKH